jgi:serine/threonine protein kinase
MGEVYEATDTRLGRVVAIKVLPSELAADPGLRERFDREARIISSLNHRHICALYDVGRQDGIDFLVMEYLDGETLADRVARGPIPLADSIALARQIADALDAAHEKGIVHRDLKPANIKVTAEGTVKVLDFGLAKATVAAAGRADQPDALTVMTTTPGTIVGTAAYMAPEQVNGREADRSSDVWAFGCVLYEMLSGRRAFEGATISEVLASVLRSEPAWQRVPSDTPPSVLRLLRRSLQKDPKLRLRDIRDARLELDERESPPAERGGASAARGRRTERLVWVSALTSVVLIAGVFGMRALRQASPSELRLEMNTPPSKSAALAISPDGSKIVFQASAEGPPQLWLRSLDSGTARPLPGTERGATPFWSPDGRSIAFVADTRLKRIDIDGGSIETLVAGIPTPLGGSWNGDDEIIYGNNPGGPIFRVSAKGGERAAATQIDTTRQRGHQSPQFLPDGRHFLFYATGTPEGRGVYVGELDGSAVKRLFDADGPAVYAADRGAVLFIRAGRLLAQLLDLDRLELRGEPLLVADRVSQDTGLSISSTGTIVYRSLPAESGQRQLLWVDRSGREIGKEVYDGSAAFGLDLSHDGRRIAVYRLVNANMDIWSFETSRRVWNRLTFGAGDDIFPVWSPDDTRVISGSVRTTNIVDLYQTFIGGAHGEEMLVVSDRPKFPMDWSADGRFLLYAVLDPKRGFDLWALPLAGDRKPFEVVATDFNEGLGQFSPDGRWIAYQSDRTGRPEIYVRPFPGPGNDFIASNAGATQVRWSGDGKELFYVGADERLMGLPVAVSPDGNAMEFGTAAPLFKTSMVSSTINTIKQQYAVLPDGRSFVLQSILGDANASPITIILNWKPER